jgi:hypothetical protein
MFEKTSQLAEKLATSVSRRHFFGSLGRWAGATALAMAGMLTTAGAARAGGKTCCTYGRTISLFYPPVTFVCGVICLPAGSPCPTTLPTGCSSSDYLLDSYAVGGCGDCTVKSHGTPTYSP